MRRAGAFPKLALATTATTYLLILVGGLVRATGAGLGCPDWPKCFGSWIPPVRADQLPPGFDHSLFNPALTWTEYLNRLLGVVVGFLIFATLAAAFVRHRRESRVLRPTLAAFLLVGFQGWLGGRVVAHGLEPWIVTAHLVVALVIVTLLLYATVNAFFGPPAPSASQRALARGAWALVALTLVQVALGTQVRSGIDEAGAQGVAREARLATVGRADTSHREVSLVVLACVLGVYALVRRRAPAGSALHASAVAAIALALGQIAMGLVLAYRGLPRTVQVAHLTLASLLLGAETLVALLATRRSSPEVESEGVLETPLRPAGGKAF